MSSLSRGIGKGGQRGRTPPLFWGQFLYISYKKRSVQKEPLERTHLKQHLLENCPPTPLV